MTHEEFVKDLSAKEQIEIKDVDELLKFTLDHREEIFFDDKQHIRIENVYIPIWFDVDKAFGLDTSNGEDYVNLYVNWSLESPEMEMYIYYCNNSFAMNEDGERIGDFELGIAFTSTQYEIVKQHFIEEFKKAYNATPSDVLRKEIEEECAE